MARSISIRFAAFAVLQRLFNVNTLAADMADTSTFYRTFKSIHSAMRQFGSSVDYENKWAFLATIQPGVQLYHGSRKGSGISGLKWLAFEPEHAMLFSHPSEHWFKTRSPGRVSSDNSSVDIDILLYPYLDHHKNKLRDESLPGRWQTFVEDAAWGYLHTYSTTRPLRVLYLDGTSAAKTTLGTLYVQDRIILQNRFKFTTNRDDDDTRAAELCRVARDDWNKEVDGFIRMETGFEVILCSFEEAMLERRGVISTPEIKDAFATYKALAQRFNGIGGERVKVDYDRFLTTHDTAKDVGNLRAELDAMILGHDEPEQTHLNWQAVADMVVERYATPLRLLASGTLQPKTKFDKDVQRLLLPFIDHGRRDEEEETARCATYALPQPPQGNAAATAILQVSKRICSEIWQALERDTELDRAVERMRLLMVDLNWSTWKACSPACKDDEVCYVPVWPFTLALDAREAPKCIDEDGFFDLVMGGNRRGGEDKDYIYYIIPASLA